MPCGTARWCLPALEFFCVFVIVICVCVGLCPAADCPRPGAVRPPPPPLTPIPLSVSPPPLAPVCAGHACAPLLSAGSQRGAGHSGRAAIRKIYLPRRNLCHHLSPISAPRQTFHDGGYRASRYGGRRGHIPERESSLESRRGASARSQSVECAINNGPQ